MKKVLFVMMGLLLNNCSHMSVSESKLNTNIDINENQYDIIGRIEGEDTYLRFLGFPLFNFFNEKYYHYGSINGIRFESNALNKTISD
tara:strand:- start:67 stop:330 length:264 start_codon:yes stop_codon:yes gene_type:complete